MPANITRSPSSAAEIAALGQRVTNIEHGLQSVADAVGALGSKLDQRSQTNWGPIWAALGVMTTALGLLGAVVYVPIKESQSRVEREMIALGDQMRAGDAVLKSELVPRREHELFWSQYQRSLDRIVTRLDRVERAQRKDDR